MRRQPSMEAETQWIISVLLLVSTICWSATIATAETSASLTGVTEQCTNEGEDVPVMPSITACFKCKCINYFVVCEPQTSCPLVDDCYMLEKKDGCCEKCKDCVHNGVRYSSGTEWTASDDPCSHLKCVAGVITVSNLQCYTPCINPVPPRPGQCCPTCDGCYLNGQNVGDGIDDGRELQLTDDCLKCHCTSDHRLHCAKHACPVLHCPVSKQRIDPGECCPRCAEKRPIGPLPGGKCVLGTGFHADGQSFWHTEKPLTPGGVATAVATTTGSLAQQQPQPLQPSQCVATVSCTCTNGTSVCRKRTCPVLECAAELQRLPSESTDCCAVCPPQLGHEEKACTWHGQVYQQNSTWTVGPCKSCRCVGGEVRCVSTNCPKLKCKANESAVTSPDQCCPQCEEANGICTVFGDPHYRTFDGRFFSFMGTCKYLLTADCQNNTFAIRVTNEDRHTKSSAWTKTVTLRLGATKVNLGQKMRVKVNGTRVLPPYSATDGTHWLTVTQSNTSDGIHVSTGLGVQLLWDGNSFLQVSASAARFKNRSLCGLCGNYNGVWRDDLMSRDGHDESKAVERLGTAGAGGGGGRDTHTINESRAVWRFGNSWRVGGARVCARQHENVVRVPQCHRTTTAPPVCRQLLEMAVFARCAGHLNPQMYVDSCKDDMCECPTYKCYCDSFAAYARECKRQGLEVAASWKAAIGCDANALAVATAVAVRERELSVAASSGRVSDAAGRRGKRLQARKHQQHHQQQQQQQQKPKSSSRPAAMPYEFVEAEFLSRHIPKTFLVSRTTGRTPPPIH